MSTKVKARNKAAGISPGQEREKISSAAYNMLGGRLGYISGKAITPEAREAFEKELVATVNEAIAAGAPAIALNILDGFRTGYDHAKKEI